MQESPWPPLRSPLFLPSQADGSISTLFGEFDDKIEPFLKREYDHAMLINIHDSLYEALFDYRERTGDSLKLKRFEAPTSVENLAHQLFSEISAMGFKLDRLEVQETDTSTVIYTRRDWLEYNRRLVEHCPASARKSRSETTDPRNLSPL